MNEHGKAMQPFTTEKYNRTLSDFSESVPYIAL